MASKEKRRTAPRSIVFMPTSTNPARDSQLPTTRKMVSKFAMMNRPKPAVKTSDESKPIRSNNANVILPVSTLSRTPKSTSPSSDSSDPEQHITSAKSSPTSLEPLSTSPRSRQHHPFGFLTNQSKDYYALDIPDAMPKKQRSKQVASKEAQFGSSPAESDATFSSSDSDGTSTVITTTELTDREYTNDDLDFDMNSPSSAAGLGILTCLSGSRYPFDCLPIEGNQHTFELIDFYLTGQYLSPAFTQGSVDIPKRVQKYRQSTWFPLALTSDVLMHALMAYVETTPGNPIPSPNQVFLLENVQAAYEGMRRRLENKKAQTDDSICTAVLLLMLTAQRVGDIHTFRRHAQGLRILLKARAHAFKHNRAIADRTEQKWRNIDVIISGPRNPDPCKYCQDSPLRPSASRSPSPPKDFDMDNEVITRHPETDKQAMNNVHPTIPIALRGAGFRDLISRGFLSPAMSNFVEEILIMAELAEHTRHDKLSAAVAVSHAWIDERPNTLPPFDTACQFSVRLCLYLSTWLEQGHNCAVVRRMAMAVFMCLRHPSVDIDTLIQECPLVMIWLSFAAGPFIEDPMTEQWFSCLLARARNATSHFANLEFNEAIDSIGSLFVWIKTMTPGARRFWNENSWDVGSATAFMNTYP